MANLRISIMIYADRSLHTDDCHVALVIAVGKYCCYLNHAVQDAVTPEEMKFERMFRTVDPMRTNRLHQVCMLESHVAKAHFNRLDRVFRETPVPRPRGESWNCQKWLLQALANLEKEGLMKKGEAQVSLTLPYFLLFLRECLLL